MSYFDPEGREHLSWRDVRLLVRQLTNKLRDERFDAYLVITRGGMVPGALIAKALDHTDVLTACIAAYDANDEPLEHPIVHEFPSEPQIHDRRILVVDDVWDKGRTIAVAKAHVRHAAGTSLVATLHYKPQRSEVDGCPDFYASKVDHWIVYPWEEDDLLPQPGMPVRLAQHLLQSRAVINAGVAGETLTVFHVWQNGDVILKRADGVTIQRTEGEPYIWPSDWLERAD